MIKKKILIIEDDIEISGIMQTVFEKEGYIVIIADNTDTGLYKVNTSRPDLILLDIKVPAVGGFEFCRIIRKNDKNKHIPIVFVTGKYIDLNDKIMGFNLGANDYIIKPFSTRELLVRAKVWLEKENTDVPAIDKIKSGKITIDYDERNVVLAGRNVKLRPKEFELLYILVKKKNKVLNRNYLTEYITGYDIDGGMRIIDVHMRNLRKKLGKYSKRIETVRNVGYRFNEKE